MLLINLQERKNENLYIFYIYEVGFRIKSRSQKDESIPFYIKKNKKVFELNIPYKTIWYFSVRDV